MSSRVRYPVSPKLRREISKARKELLANRERLDPLFKLFRDWARAEHAPLEQWVLEGDVLWQMPVRDRPVQRQKLFRSVKEIVAVLIYKHTVGELVTLAALGDDMSLIRLVELDKTFLTAQFAQKRIRQAQGMEDRDFFKVLSGALLVDAYRENQDEVWLGVACYLLWFLGFERLPKIELYTFLKSGKAMPYRDPESFKRWLTRIGLRRYRKAGPRKR